jgi:adenine-specific DNA-methyltransferase
MAAMPETVALTASSAAAERLPLTTPEFAAERLARLRELLPGAFAEGRLVPQRLAELVGAAAISSHNERYGLSYAGRGEAIKAMLAPSRGTLRPDHEVSVNWATTENLIIEGDNLEVLKLLQSAYAGAVKLIYIDPPYNTGNDFVYPDDYKLGIKHYLELTQQELSTNAETSGRYHSDWLKMMHPRLALARNLLRDDGVIFVSIDDHEVANLRLLMDEVFGEENFVAHIVWQKRYVSNATAKHLSDMHDHVLVFSRRAELLRISLQERSEEQLEDYRNLDDDPRGPWRAQDLSASKPYQAGLFEIEGPTGRKFNPPPGRYWRCNGETFDGWRADNRIWWGKNRDARPMLKAFLSEAQQGLRPHTWWGHDFAGHNKEATLEMKDLFDGETPFDTAKPRRLLLRILNLVPEKDTLVLDFFAGSGTTAHAVLDLNRQDGGNRKFILVQFPEPTGREDFRTISDITRERVRRVIARRAAELPTAAAEGFRAFRLAESNFKLWDGTSVAANGTALAQQLEWIAHNVVDDRTDGDLLAEILLKCGHPGVTLSSPVELRTVVGQPVHFLAGGTLAICLSRHLNPEVLRGIIATVPKRVLCMDVAFGGSDQLKTNTVLEMQSHGIQFQTV